jgi:hypothetical protein
MTAPPVATWEWLVVASPSTETSTIPRESRPPSTAASKPPGT